MEIFTGASLIAFAFLLGLVDGSFGMGYGTLFAPILLVLGFDPLQAIPAVLISQLSGDFLAAFFHHRFENADLSIGSSQFRMAMTLALLGVASSIVAVAVAINLKPQYLSLYIGLSTFIVGIVVLTMRTESRSFSWRRFLLLGGFASFNKGLSGGGYGPIVAAGQILTGRNIKSAVGITSLAEGITCMAAFLMYFLMHTHRVDWLVPLLLSIGIAISTPVSALIIKRSNGKTIKLAIGMTTVTIGLWTIVRILEF